MASNSRSRSRRRPPTFYGESDSEEISRPTRTRVGRPSYVESEDDDENAAHDGSEVEMMQTLPKQSPPRRTLAHSTKRKVQPGKKSPYASYKRQKVLGAPLKRNPGLRNDAHAVLPGGKIPPWQNLEYDILTNILKKAAYPLFQDYIRPNASIRWLVGLSYLCRSFRDAALSALLYSPPLINGNGLMGLLRINQDALSTNYRMKPRKLVVEAKHSLVQKADKISLPELVSLTPLLESLRLVSSYDEIQAIWAHPSAAKKTYIYEDALFDSLSASCPRLKEFEWNGRFAAGLPELIDMIDSAHTKLSGLTSITLMNLNIAEKLPIKEQESLQARLQMALTQLPELKQLTITNCDVFGNLASLASLETSQLKSLTITECPSVTSAGLEMLLSAKGAALQHLRLIGCQTCDGSFLSRLNQLCASLQTLHIDSSFTDVSSWHDTDAHYENFLPDGPISFPTTLVDLDLNNLRRIDSAQLEACLTSLVETSLPSLRRLSIKAILTSDYRQRARIRREWGQKLERVYLRRSLPPVSYSQPENKFPVGGVAMVRESSATSTSDDSKKRHSSRLFNSQNTISVVVNKTEPLLQVQGLCEVVALRVDDQRPAKDQFKEHDFLDEEISGDEMYHD
jgi:hypothetical protein